MRGDRERVTHWVFADETGDFRSQPYLIIGMVRTSDPTRHEAELRRCCADHNFDSEIKYSSTNRRSLDVKKAFIDYFCDVPDLEFRCIVKSKDLHDVSKYQNNHLKIPAKDMAYNHTYNHLLANNLKEGERAVVWIDDKSRTPNDNLIPYLQWAVTRAADIQPKDSKDARLLQMADLLVGCVYGSLTNNNHPVKGALHRYLLERQGLSTVAYKCPGDKFNIWHWRPPR